MMLLYYLNVWMSTMKSKPSQELLLEYLAYDPNTGHLTWIKKAGNSTVLNSRAGSTSKSGYRRLMFKGKQYQEHHVIWCMVHGYFPPEQLDHDDQVRDNNRISNLIEVTQSENSRNRARRNTSIDEAGIWYCKRRRRYIAEITFEGKKVFQKSYQDIEQAIEERQAKLKEYGFNENHGKSNHSNRKFL